MTTHERPGAAGVDPPRTRRLPAPRAPSDSDLRSQLRWKTPDAIVVEVAGEIDLCTVARLETALEEHIRSRPGVLRVDLGEVRFLGAAGIRALLRAQGRAEDAGVHLVVDPGGSRGAARALELLERLQGRALPVR